MTKQANGARAEEPDCGEALSRLIDGDLDAGACRQLFERLVADDDAKRNWVLLSVACDAVRSSETAALHSAGFVTRVGAALAMEPVILAPGALRHRHGIVRRVVLPAAAVAAAAAVLLVVAVPQLRLPGVADPQIAVQERKTLPSKVVEADAEVVRSAEFEAYMDAHRESAQGPVTSPNEYISNATLTTESR